MKVRALLDSASSASFISERLTHLMEFPRTHQNLKISGVAGLSHATPSHSIVQFAVSPVNSPADKAQVSAIVVPRVTCDLPVKPVTPQLSWKHLSDIPLADPDFGRPGRNDLLLGVDLFVASLLQGRRTGPPGSPTAFETKFGWVLAGLVESQGHPHQIATHHASLVETTSSANFGKLKKVQEATSNSSPRRDQLCLTSKKVIVVMKAANSSSLFPGNLTHHHWANLVHKRSEGFSLSSVRYIQKNEFSTFDGVMQEYFDLGHAEPVPTADLEKPEKDVFYLPMHAVNKESSTTTKIRAVFDASAKSSSGVSLNDLLLVGPTVHSSLIDVLLRFRLHRIAITTDVSKMYRAIQLAHQDRDLHRFVWNIVQNNYFKTTA